MAAIAEPRRRIDMTSKRNQLILGNMSTRGSTRANGTMPRTPSCRRERPSIARATLNGIGFVAIPPISITTSQSPGRNYRPAETPCLECRARNDRRKFCAAAVVGDSTASRINTPIACRPLRGAGGRAGHLARAPAQRMEDLAGIGDLLEPWKSAPLEQSSLIRIARCGNLSRGRVLPKIMEPPTLLHQVRVSSRDSIGAGQFFCF